MRDVRRLLHNWHMLEQLFYWLVLLILIFLPLIFWDYSDYHERKRIVWGWMRIFPFIIIFLVHNYFLLPLAYRKEGLWKYLILTILLIVGVNVLIIYYDPLREALYEMFMGSEFQRGRHGFPGKGQQGGGPGVARHFRRYAGQEFLFFINNFLIGLFLVGFNATLNFTSRWFTREQERKELSKENLQSQLSALRQQVSPHFFMNTLNNIHALIDYNQPAAKESILRLSELMRYLLYDTDRETVPLKREVEFLKSYIDLMKLRLTEKVELRVKLPDKFKEVYVPPFLLLPFVENAFKYGILPEGSSSIEIHIELLDDQLHFTCMNTKFPNFGKKSGPSGIGIANARKRLELIFGDAYTLVIRDINDTFEVEVRYPVQVHKEGDMLE